MALKLFKGKIEPRCSLCEYAELTNNGNAVLCRKVGGIMLSESKCKKYKYDPLKRVPRTIVFKGDFTKDDFDI